MVNFRVFVRFIRFAGQYSAAISSFEKALLLYPSHAPILKVLASLCYNIGETEKALYWWGKYKEREVALEQHKAHRVTTARTGAIGRA